ncbi:hypothetical protein [Pseudoalteromonas luteoviolacea]|uniref:Uncharacterized protein n=1 Tax=Pseudoalteromonas luteoviolacea DSM 6061 TaxID=1365250 RepID=A0A166Z9F5_9GAMM|nr:hypothetical protein [Pseudoalteromonas luteoviolacea]KZN44082.1 hypothetical protein N475_08210 [Pseudoalteromonas luteoviolacea DSM 6061]MBE0386195.1 hypothetical protein [Pseudoalteromonas luteoviolacea DSM 6061]TQF71097.1 hypothetical protein FLM44_08410 [Pseudoalteromonas luteoviolacea]
MTEVNTTRESMTKESKSYKANVILLLVSLVFSAATFILYAIDKSNFDHVLSFVKLGYMFFFVALYAYLVRQWVKSPESLVKGLLWLSLFQIATMKLGEWNLGLNPFSVIGVSLDLGSVSITINVIAIAILGFTWRYKQRLKLIKI